MDMNSRFFTLFVMGLSRKWDMSLEENRDAVSDAMSKTPYVLHERFMYWVLLRMPELFASFYKQPLKVTLFVMTLTGWGLPIIHCGESRWSTSQVRWQCVRGHDKPRRYMGVAIYSPGGVQLQHFFAS